MNNIYFFLFEYNRLYAYNKLNTLQNFYKTSEHIYMYCRTDDFVPDQNNVAS